MLILPVSFFFLVQFGINAIVRVKNGNAALRMIPLGLMAVWIIITGISSQRFLIGSISARYLLCIPGTLVTAYALICPIATASSTRDILTTWLNWLR
jgi:hypothetical protein